MGVVIGLLLALVACLAVVMADRLFGLSNIYRRIRDALRSARRYLGRE
ncbi:hypothetical protein M8A51_25590 [Schlegelella sp. S2-27]|uniref:Uncharacterized protein n=1 Tax=Caldimonas mangrovi TaxID=2944811 RepID=A0ABT0YVY3_9BURK|nr:hypothetical protein [Caldimonas mangrovi]MCM5682910.1 hypothetical protein [Caldimonas mangrovi]